MLASPNIFAKLSFWNSSEQPEATPVTFNEASTPFIREGVVSYASAVEKALGAVVSIHTTKTIPQEAHPLLKDPFFRHFFGPDAIPQMPGNAQQPGLGSGVIVHKDGYILTNAHVIQDAEDIEVTLSDNRTIEANVVGADPESDLAILKIEANELPVIVLGDSTAMRVGDVVLAIGNPYGVGQTVTQGIISATGRSNLGINTYENFIQTDAAISPGNSGGALIDAYGNLIGINTAILASMGANQGIGFAIPIDLAKSIMSQIIDQGHVVRGWLGISVRDLTPKLRESLKYPEGEGTVVAGVLRNGPAHLAGLLPGDVIMSVDGRATSSARDIVNVTSKLEPGSKYPIVVSRSGDIFDFQVQVELRPSDK